MRSFLVCALTFLCFSFNIFTSHENHQIDALWQCTEEKSYNKYRVNI